MSTSFAATMGFSERKTLAEMLEGVTEPVDSARLLKHCTVEICYSDGVRAIRYHDTDIISKYDDGMLRLDSGGFRRMSTIGRFNEYMPEFGLQARIWTHARIWYVAIVGKHVENLNVYPSKGYVFYDGMEFDWEGNLITGEVDRSAYMKEVNRIKREIKAVFSDGGEYTYGYVIVPHRQKRVRDGLWNDATSDMMHIDDLSRFFI